jgi:hypothetical protein
MGGNISREGITADLESMARVGIGGAAIFNIGGHGAQGKVIPLSPEWRELMGHALREAKRLGIEINLNNSMVGWSSSGGPWITPELAMQCLTWSETAVRGPQSAAIVLPQPPGHLGYYRDVAVLAFPTPEAECETNACEVASNMERFERKLLDRFSDVPLGRSWDKNDTTPAVAVQMKVSDKSAPFIQWNYTEAVVQRSMQITSRSGSLSGTLKASDDGAVWREVQAFESRNHSPVTCALEAAPAKFWRVEFKPNEELWLTGVRLWSGYRIANYTGKAMFDPYGLDCPKFTNDGQGKKGNMKRGTCFVQPDKMVDLTDKMKADGTLDWKVPVGRWTILRFGYAPTGSESEPRVPGVRSLECDKFDPKALEVHFAKSLQPWFDDPELNAAVQYVHVDSYERGAQNWTAALPELFMQRKGYDLRTWLPALTGRVIGSVRESERFLWDFRNVTCGLMHENYFGRMAELCEKDGKRFTCEPYHQTQFNNVTAGGYAHIPMCEAWMGDSIPGPYWMKLGASPGHLYGRRIVGAEAFTAPAKSGGNWSIDFFDMKELGDAMFCGGVNRFMYHVYVQQPWTNVAPGQTLAIYGTHFERTNTWFEKMKAYNAYVTRCQALLQQGLFVGDVLYSCGENNPSENVQQGGALAMPNGYDYDVCDPRAIRERITVKDGQLVLPDGVRYRLLVLPDDPSMTLAMLRRVEALVKDGATIVGRTKPAFSPTLSDTPEQMGTFKRLADALWDSGRVISDKTVAEVLKLKGILPDFEARGAKAHIRYIHRREGGTDTYFVASSGKEAQKVEAVFRTTAGQPVLLDAVTGESRVLPEYRVEDGRTIVPMSFEAKQSFFVVFGKEFATKDAKGEKNFAEGKLVQEVSGPWDVTFDPKWFYPVSSQQGQSAVVFEKLEDWSKRTEEAIRYYSGTAVYRKLFDCRLPTAACPLYLSLGAVKNVADVTLNGWKLGTVWCAPWRVAIPSGVLKEKGNELEIEVVNLWPNRMIGDEQLPEDCDWGGGAWNLLKGYPEWFVNKILRASGRKTFSTVKQWYKDDPLMPSGLLGPVTVQAEYAIAWMTNQSGYAQVSQGLQVEDGHFYKDGQVYRGVGANYFDLFRRVMREPTNTTSLAGLERLSKAGIPFVRFAGPFSAQEWKLYLENKEEYFKFENSRAYMIPLVAEANRAWHKQ